MLCVITQLCDFTEAEVASGHLRAPGGELFTLGYLP